MKTASAAAESGNRRIFSPNDKAAARINQIRLTARIDGDSEMPSKNQTGKTKENTRAREKNHERIPHAGTERRDWEIATPTKGRRVAQLTAPRSGEATPTKSR
jgi:hypothetical protein